MIKILQKICFREEIRLQGERRLKRHVLGDTLDSTINLQLKMLGKINGTKATRTKYRNNPVFAKQNEFFYARSAPFVA